MRKVELRMNEQEKFDIIKRSVSKEISVQRAAIKIGCTIRTVYNLIKVYKQKGKEGFIHGNRGRKPSTTIPDDIKNTILLLYERKYEGANYKHFQELLKENENINISYYALYNLLNNNSYISPKCEHLTLRRYNKMLKEKLKNKKKLSSVESQYIATTNLDDSIKHNPHPLKPRAKYFGELLQMDASNHNWFGTTKSHLHLAIDDATGRILGAYFDSEETLNGYYNVFHQILSEYGIPANFLTDRRTVFEYKRLKEKNKKDPSIIDEKDTLTQFGYACHLLGVDLLTSSIAEVKGRVERMFGTLQSRLVTELKVAGICTLDKANEFLNSYIKKFNQQFSIPINSITSVFDTQIDIEKINYTLSIITKRAIKGGNITLNKKQYELHNEHGRICFQDKVKCFIMKTFDGQLIATVNEKIYNLIEFKDHKLISKQFDIEEPIKPKYKGHKPDLCHPWTYYSYKAKKSKRGIEIA